MNYKAEKDGNRINHLPADSQVSPRQVEVPTNDQISEAYELLYQLRSLTNDKKMLPGEVFQYVAKHEISYEIIATELLKRDINTVERFIKFLYRHIDRIKDTSHAQKKIDMLRRNFSRWVSCCIEGQPAIIDRIVDKEIVEVVFIERKDFKDQIFDLFQLERLARFIFPPRNLKSHIVRLNKSVSTKDIEYAKCLLVPGTLVRIQERAGVVHKTDGEGLLIQFQKLYRRGDQIYSLGFNEFYHWTQLMNLNPEINIFDSWLSLSEEIPKVSLSHDDSFDLYASLELSARELEKAKRTFVPGTILHLKSGEHSLLGRVAGLLSHDIGIRVEYIDSVSRQLSGLTEDLTYSHLIKMGAFPVAEGFLPSDSHDRKKE